MSNNDTISNDVESIKTINVGYLGLVVFEDKASAIVYDQEIINWSDSHADSILRKLFKSEYLYSIQRLYAYQNPDVDESNDIENHKFNDYESAVKRIIELYKITEDEEFKIDRIREMTSLSNDKNYKPIYHVFLVLNIPDYLDHPITLFSTKYKKRTSLDKMLALCNNELNPLLTLKDEKNNKIDNIITKFKLKYGINKVPIRSVDYNFIQKHNLSLYHNNFQQKLI